MSFKFSEKNVERILRNGPQNTNELRIPTNLLNADKKGFLEGLASGKSLGTIYPGGKLLQGFRETTNEAGIVEPSAYFMMPKQEPANRYKSLASSGMLSVVAARPKKFQAPPAFLGTYENSNTSIPSSGNEGRINVGNYDPKMLQILKTHGLGPRPYGKTKKRKGRRTVSTRRYRR